MFLALTIGASLLACLPELRAIAFLSSEVPRWFAENKCYSCHNNGDAARALYTARRLGYAVPDRAIDDTSGWLAKPGDWDHNKGDERFSDKVLARIQFAAGLADGIDSGDIKAKKALIDAAERLVNDQHKDGSWRIEAEGNIGSPATYGATLATYMARRTLERADRERFAAAIAKADQWLLKLEIHTVLDAASVLLALDGREGDAAAAQRRRCLKVIREGQSKDGGWGPYVNSPSEAFDTALVMLALLKQDEKPMLKHGRDYLITTQQPDGSWQETTRPVGRTSYAQRISTTGWATLSLLATRTK